MISALATTTIALIWPNDYDWDTTRAIGANQEAIVETKMADKQEPTTAAAATGTANLEDDMHKEKDLTTDVAVQAVNDDAAIDEEAARGGRVGEDDDNNEHLDIVVLQKVFWKAAIVSSTMAFIIAVVSSNFTTFLRIAT